MNTTRVTVSLPTDLVARLNAAAAGDDRSRSALVRLALRQALAAEPNLPGATMAGASVDAAAGTGAPSPSPAAPSYPASLHIAALRRQAALADERAGADRQQRERVIEQTAAAMKGIRE